MKATLIVLKMHDVADSMIEAVEQAVSSEHEAMHEVTGAKCENEACPVLELLSRDSCRSRII